MRLPSDGVEERRLRQRERLAAVVGQAGNAAARGRDGREHDEGDEGESRALPHIASLPVAPLRTGSIRSPWLPTPSPC